MKNQILTAMLCVASAPAYAAPFLVCNLDINSSVIVDLGDNTMKLNNSKWAYAKVIVSNIGISAEFAGSGALLGIAYSYTDGAVYKIASPGVNARYGEAFCAMQDK